MSYQFVDNKHAQSLFERVRDADDIAPLQYEFDHVVADSSTRVGDDVAYRALAAAEVVAAMRGNMTDEDLPTEIAEWAAAREADDALVNDASRAVHLVLTGSKLGEQWRAEGRYDEFQQRVRNLQLRLGKDGLFQH